ncbi:unnamed protein product [Closterium sp. NIES-64]|nr:unnamed protein product [Closterium sp. NIES-64]
MEAMPADEAAPDTGPDEPPVTAKPTAPSQPEKASDAPRSGLDFLRATAAPVTPEPPRSTVHDSAPVVTPTPAASPIPVPFTLPSAIVGCSKDPPPPSPSLTPSTVWVSLGPPSATSAPKRARSGKWAQSSLLVGGHRIPPPEKPDEPAQIEGELSEEGDIPTEIAKTIESTTSNLTECYLTPEKAFGGEGKSWLVNFLKVHKEGGGKQVWVRGVDGAGRPINHLYTMHERKLKGHKHGSTYADCVKLCRKFARDCVDNLNNRLDDLGKLGPTKLFRAGKWPKIKAQREKKCKEWLNGCSRLFRNKLPGFDLKAAERELPAFCAIMEAHHEMESFTQGLPNFLGSADSKRERRGKQKEGEDVAARNAGENEDEEEEEEEEDDEVEQAFGNDQEIEGEEEAEDNPFLSDDEDVEEVYFIDKPVH